MTEQEKETLGLNPLELYSTRLLVFVETAPQSNKYHQVHMDSEEFKKCSISVGDIVEKKDHNGIQTIALRMSVDSYDLPDLKEIN